MLAVREEYRGLGIATKLARMTIDAMIEQDADEVSPPVPLPPGKKPTQVYYLLFSSFD